MTWVEKNKYYLQNNTSTICKVKINDKQTYELWHDGKQYAGFLTADEAKHKHDKLEATK